MRPVQLVDIRVTGFRNLKPERVVCSPRGNLVVGGNGHGKTSLLEAIAVLGNLRSFRTASMRQVVTHGEREFYLEGRIETPAGVVRLGQRVDPGPPVRRFLTIGGAEATIPQYLGVFPVLALSGSDRELVVGAPSGRRAFIDRFTFLLEKEYFQEIREYRKVLRQRNAALGGAVQDREMVIWEGRLASAAAAVVDRRTRMCRRLVESFGPTYDDLRGEGFPDVELQYRGEADVEPAENVMEVEEYYRKRYNETRARDRRTGFTGEGPHRHDLGLRANGRMVRHVLSSGQIKVVAAALRLASLKQIELERGEWLPVIIDDVDAELDGGALSRLIGHLGGLRQLFLSSADNHVFETLDEGSSRFEIRHGTVFDPAGERTDE